jgi:hypothetical protein
MVVSLLPGSAPGMVVSMFVGISTLKPSAAVDMIMEDICGSFCPCSYKKKRMSCKTSSKSHINGATTNWFKLQYVAYHKIIGEKRTLIQHV